MNKIFGKKVLFHLFKNENLYDSMTNLHPRFLDIAILRQQIFVSHFFVSQRFVSADLCLHKIWFMHFFVSQILVFANLGTQIFVHKTSSANICPQNKKRKFSFANVRPQIFVSQIFVYSFL